MDGERMEPARLEVLRVRARSPRSSTTDFFRIDGCGGLLQRVTCGVVPEPWHGPWSVSVVLDGFLAEREELLHKLEAEGVREIDVTLSDEALVRAAYECWGVDFPARLIGEFAVIVWDSSRQRLLAARDPFGIRELFYTEFPSGLQVASQTAQLVSSPSLSDIDEEYLADFLAAQVCIGESTPFRSVRRLRAGHRLVVEKGRARAEKYWELDHHRDIRYADDHEYTEHFSELLTRSVRQYLGRDGRVWAEVSGGLDSSSIACLLSRLVQGDPSLDRGVSTLSLVWDESPRSDERRWSKPVVDLCGFPHHWVRGDDLFFDEPEQGAYYRNEPHFALFMYPLLRREADLLGEHDVDVLLSGSRAESVVLPSTAVPLHLADLLQQWKLGRVLREALRWQQSLNMPLLNLLLWNAFKPLLNPRHLKHSWADKLEIGTWVREEFARRWHLPDRGRRGFMPLKFGKPTMQYQYELLYRSEQSIHRGYLSWACELRFPFLYRPLVEFAMSVPWEQKARPGEHKLLLRRSMKDILPEIVRTRKGTRGPSPAAFKAFARRWGAIEPLLRSPVLASLGVVDAEAFLEAGRRLRMGASENFVAFTSCLALEYWLRHYVR